MIERTAIPVLFLWVVALAAGPALAAGAGEASGNPLLQPQALNWAGIYALRQIDPSLTGAGVRVGVVCRSYTYNEDSEPQNDYRPNVEHACFSKARLQFHNDLALPPRQSPHSTAICSILFGEDPQGLAPALDPFLYQGVVPGAAGRIYEFWHFVKQLAQKAPAVDVATASFGQPLEDWWTRGIEALVEHEGLVFVASIGNGSNASDPPFYPGAGSNTIGVGVVSSVNAPDSATKLANFALAYPQESSVGPTDDGRCKPDVIAPGNCLVAAADGNEGYTMTGNWSSFSTPVAAGVVGLLIQAARKDDTLRLAASPQGGSSVLKAILMSSAVKLPYWHKGRLSTEDDHEVPLDYAQGAGMVHAARAYRLLTAGRGEPGNVSTAGWDLNQLEATRTFQRAYRITVDGLGNQVLTATLVWNRHYDPLPPFKRLSDKDSDLRLEVWAVNPADPSKGVLVDYSDSKVDNVEHIHFETVPGYRQYQIVVSYADLDGRLGAAGSEAYALAWSAEAKVREENILWYDLNADGIVNDQDFIILMNNLTAGRTSSQAYLIGDINRDGTIDAMDMDEMLKYRNDKANWYASGAAK